MIFTNSMFAWEVSFTVRILNTEVTVKAVPMAPWQACLEGCVFFFLCVYECVCLEPD
jgi:hypothetical protein